MISSVPVAVVASASAAAAAAHRFVEPMLVPDDARYVMFPIQHPDIWDMYQKQVSCFWRPEEISFVDDMPHWDRLTEDEKRFIKQILAFFASSDGIVLENLASRFMQDVQWSEARAFYGFQIAMENIHSHTYSLLIDTYVTDPVEKDALFHALEHYPCIQKKAHWAQQWIHDHRHGFATRLLAFACVEGIFFSGAFCSIYWLKHRGVLPGLTFSNELISRDESLHCEFAVLLYSKLQHKLPRSKVVEVIKQAVDIETEFIVSALPCRLIGMNDVLMVQYIQYMADRLLLQLGHKVLYNVSQPFTFVEKQSIDSKSSMFERRNPDYALANKTRPSEDAFVCDDSMDF